MREHKCHGVRGNAQQKLQNYVTPCRTYLKLLAFSHVHIVYAIVELAY